MNIYSRARRHINMERVKELNEENYIKNLERQQEIILAEIFKLEKEKNKHFDWRTGKGLTEQMTTAAIGLVNLPAEGDVDIIDTGTTYDNLNSGLSQMDNYSRSGTTVTLQGTENQIVNGDHTYYNVARYVVDATRVSHVKITISKGGGTSSWTDRDGESNFDDGVSLNISDQDDFFAPRYYDGDLSSGTHVIPVPGNYKKLMISFEQFGKVGETGALTISNVSLQRRTPVSAFVSLDDPEANAFLRDGQTDNLSPGEKKKKLEEQLASSKEYLNKMFGEGMPNTATTIADYEPQQSFSDIAQGLPYTDEDDAFDNDYYKGPPPDLDDDSDFDPDSFEYAGLRPDGTQGFNKPGDEVYDPATKKKYKLVPRKGYGYNQWVPIEKAGRGDTMVAHHELEGEVIVEKKRLKSPKDLADKIPGYYDGKPAPLGFPIVEPPKMKNGMHPDLVDGKKTAKRFNRLDPVSARAMPKTGNSLIDKKVKSAAKKSK